MCIDNYISLIHYNTHTIYKFITIVKITNYKLITTVYYVENNDYSDIKYISFWLKNIIIIIILNSIKYNFNDLNHVNRLMI